MAVDQGLRSAESPRFQVTDPGIFFSLTQEAANRAPGPPGGTLPGMGVYTERILPRLLHVAMRGRPFAAERPRCVAGARGRVLEVGFGSGLNLPFYGPRVQEVLALEPCEEALRLARPAIERAPFPVRALAPVEGGLPLANGSIDTAVSTWTFCTISDLGALLAELRRVLSADGELRFLEHGLAPSPRTARWQRRLDPLQQRLAGGCRLTRRIDRLVADAGFELVEIEQYALPGPRVWSWTYRGIARPR